MSMSIFSNDLPGLMQKKLLAVLLFLSALFFGCDNSLIYENLEECPHGVYVSFYSQTECAQEPSYIGTTPILHLFAFDVNGTLAAIHTATDVTLDKDFKVLMPISGGVYTFIAWAGAREPFKVAKFEVGKTTKKDVMMTLESISGKAPVIGDQRVWQGESSIIAIADHKTDGSVFEEAKINLLEVTNRIRISVELHESILKDTRPADFSVSVSSANGVIAIDRKMPFGSPVLEYPTHPIYTADKVLTTFTLPEIQTGYNSMLKIYNNKTGAVIWEGDFVGSLLLKNKNVNINCVHDYDLKFVIKDKCLDCGTYICWAIYLNDWQIHSYEAEVGGEIY